MIDKPGDRQRTCSPKAEAGALKTPTVWVRFPPRLLCSTTNCLITRRSLISGLVPGILNALEKADRLAGEIVPGSNLMAAGTTVPTDRTTSCCRSSKQTNRGAWLTSVNQASCQICRKEEKSQHRLSGRNSAGSSFEELGAVVGPATPSE